MTQHTHREYVEGCFRCELSRDESEREAIIAAINEQVDRLAGSPLSFARLRHGYVLQREDS